MQSKHFWSVLGIGLATTVGLAVGATSAQAATWHKWTPTALRGTWKSKPVNMVGTTYRYPVIIGKNSVGIGHGVGDPTVTKSAMYHHKAGSHYYYVKSHETLYSNGAQVDYFKFYKVGHKMRYRVYLVHLDGKFYKGTEKPNITFYKQ